jgi:hypothetical protein
MAIWILPCNMYELFITSSEIFTQFLITIIYLFTVALTLSCHATYLSAYVSVRDQHFKCQQKHIFFFGIC